MHLNKKELSLSFNHTTDTEAGLLDMDYFRTYFSPPSSVKSDGEYNKKSKTKKRAKKVSKFKNKNIHSNLLNNCNNNSQNITNNSNVNERFLNNYETNRTFMKCHYCQEKKKINECLLCTNKYCKERFCNSCFIKFISKKKSEAMDIFNKKMYQK
jgi:hypothetical protein